MHENMEIHDTFGIGFMRLVLGSCKKDPVVLPTPLKTRSSRFPMRRVIVWISTSSRMRIIWLSKMADAAYVEASMRSFTMKSKAIQKLRLRA